MKDLCSIHISKECHEILQNLSRKYSLDIRRMANFCITEAAKEIMKDNTKILNIFQEQALQTAPPTAQDIINTLFDRVALEERDYVFQSEIYLAVRPKKSAEPQEIDKLGYKRYFPDGKLILAWKKN